ncbi:MAG: hypothetical protein K1W10_00120 [Lachnospiraceae bacterium]
MLRGIPRLILPDFMKVLMEMGHGDEIVFGDANFPAESIGRRVIHMESSEITEILEAVMPFFTLDNFVDENAVLMSVVEGRGEAPSVWERYETILRKYDAEKAFGGFSFLTREAFYERAKTAYAVVATGEREKYANLILKLGVVEGEKEWIG